MRGPELAQWLAARSGQVTHLHAVPSQRMGDPKHITA
jgi:hypothetical protein